MEGAEEIGKDAHDSALLHNNENGPIVADTELEKEGSPPLPEGTIQLEIKESSHSSEDSPLLELPLYEDNLNPVHISTLYPEDHVQPAANGLHLPIDDQSLVEPGAHVSEIEGDACNSGSSDGATLDSTNRTFHTLPGDKSLEGNELVENGNEMNIGDTSLESPTDSEIKEGELTNELATEQTLLDCDLKEEEMNEGVDRMKLLPENETKEDESNGMGIEMEHETGNEVKDELLRKELDIKHEVEVKTPQKSFLLEADAVEGDDSGTEMEQVSFMKELETFHKERCLEFKPPKFYGEPLNCLKLWRAVVRLGGYEQVTSCKLWRQVGESFKPPKTCTTVSWTFRCFYEKALLEYEKYKMRNGELPFTDVSFTAPATAGNQASVNQASGSGRARRDAAARAMQGWHSQRLLSNGEVGDPIIKDKNSSSLPKREKQLKNIGLLKRKKPSPVDRADKVLHIKASKSHLNTMAVDIGPPADWVKVNVQRTKDCFEVYALVPGLLREEVRVQSDPAGRLVISGQPEQLDNPWGVAPFKKVVSLPSRIDPHQTSAVVTLHGQLFVRVPFEPSD